MPETTASNPVKPDKAIWYFIICWTVLNAIQAYTLEVHADEAYYWIYSRLLDWGYFDHPPMVAVFIRIGYSIFHNEFGLRLLTVFTNSAAIYLLWLMVKAYGVKAKWFILLVSGVFIFHVYGFTTTPDAPLFIFTVLFYYVYRQYLQNGSPRLALLLAVIIACLLYSKYHGILVIGFTVLSNLSLLKRRSFWGIVIAALVLFIPHIWWQVSHNYPSLSYHLFDRSAKGYNFGQTGTYIPAQLAMAGPFIGWFIFYSAFKNRITDAFIRALIVNAVGTFIFFLINTLKVEVQPHWTLIAFVPLVMLALIRISTINKPYKWLTRLAIINVGFIVLLRVSIMFGPDLLKNVGQLKSYYGFKEWAHLVKQKAGDSYVVMNEGFQNPSKYDFYNNTLKGFSYDSRDYRYTQFDIWPLEDSLQHKRIYYLLQYPLKGITTDTIKCGAGTWYGGWVDDARTYQKITIEGGSKNITVKQKQKIQFDLTITNPYPFAVNFTNQGYKHAVVLEVCTAVGKSIINVQPTNTLFNNIKLKTGQSAHLKVAFICPAEKGDYSLFFSIRTDPFTGSRNSRQVKLKVE
jgi:hypothetical protein